MSPVMYLIGQNCYEYNGLESIEDGLKTNENRGFKHTLKYLQIKPEQIYIDDEVDKFLKENDWFNSEFHVLDLTQHDYNVYTI
jgi:hypothetical protein